MILADSALLALLLSPWKDEKMLGDLGKYLRTGSINWEHLIQLGEDHSCSPLLAVCLKKDHLWRELPENARTTLTRSYRANSKRTALFLIGLDEILQGLTRQKIPAILLKGAATFCDQLFEDYNARYMCDIDILLPSESLAQAQALLRSLGYRKNPNPFMEPEGLPTDARHCHLPLYYKSTLPGPVEIHYRLAYAQAGRVLPVAAIWEGKVTAYLDHNPVYLLNPTHRVLHNAVHALAPDRGFIRGRIPLLQLAEFVHLTKKYRSSIDWPTWLEGGRSAGLALELLTYLELAHRLMAMPYPPGLPRTYRAGLHSRRFLQTANYGGLGDSRPLSRFERFGQRLIGLVLKLYYLAKLPGWVWRNICYVEDKGNYLTRLKYVFKKISQRNKA